MKNIFNIAVTMTEYLLLNRSSKDCFTFIYNVIILTVNQNHKKDLEFVEGNSLKIFQNNCEIFNLNICLHRNSAFISFCVQKTLYKNKHLPL